MTKKTWTIPTILSHLQSAYREATGYDIMDPEVAASLEMSTVIETLKSHHMDKEMKRVEIPGQTTLPIEDDSIDDDEEAPF